MRITIPDDLADRFQAYADRQGLPLDTVITTALTAVADVEPGVRSITFSGDLLEEVEAIVGRLPAKSATDLAAKIKGLAGVSFRHIRFDFSPSQLRELEHQASRQGKSVKAVCEAAIRKIETDLFWHVQGPAAAQKAG